MIKCNECGYEGSQIKTVDASETSAFNCEVCPQCSSHHIDYFVDTQPIYDHGKKLMQQFNNTVNQ